MARTPFPVVHHFQKTDHTCGPASLRMVFDSLWGAALPEAELADWLSTDASVGTRQKAIETLVSRFGLKARPYHTETTVDDLRELLKKGHVIMVLYHLEEETTDHYAVVKEITNHYVVLNDPWLGPDVPIAIHEFEALWVTRDEVPGRKDRWALAVRQDPLAHAAHPAGSDLAPVVATAATPPEPSVTAAALAPVADETPAGTTLASVKDDATATLVDRKKREPGAAGA